MNSMEYLQRSKKCEDAVLSRRTRVCITGLVGIVFLLVLGNSNAFAQPGPEMRPPEHPMGAEGEDFRERRFEKRFRKWGEEGRRRPHDGRLGRVKKFLQFVKGYHEAVATPQSAIGLAALGIKDSYKQQGAPLKAVKDLDAILAETKDRKARNILLFTIRQVYEEQRDHAKMLELNKRIIAENITELSEAK